MNIETPLRLDGALTIVASQAQRERLLAAAQECDSLLRLDLSAVEEFDSAGVQLLLATRKTMALRGGGLQLEAASTVVREVLAAFGLDVLLRRTGGA
jgi:anti-sigma B factor antagonist